MTTAAQKDRERQILEYYARIAGLDGLVSAQERPDFVIGTVGRRIGVEITEYHQPAYGGNRYRRTQVEAEWMKLREAVVEYRETHAGLEGLSVFLEFSALKVPKRAEHAQFIGAVADEVQKARDRIGDKFRRIRITDQHPSILRRYLENIRVRFAGCYLEWDWNHMVAGAGTSENELLAILRPKLGLVRPDGIDELHLVVAGDGPTAASYIGYLVPSLLDGWVELGSALDKSCFDVVAILNYDESCIRRKGSSWAEFKHVL